ncbi:hypothetical protein [Streptomyces sp. NPDC055134]
MLTGHVYGIFLDRCSLLAAPEVVLSQCELEYLRSRSILDHDQDEVLVEMKRIDSWLCEYLAIHGWATDHKWLLRTGLDLWIASNSPCGPPRWPTSRQPGAVGAHADDRRATQQKLPRYDPLTLALRHA